MSVETEDRVETWTPPGWEERLPCQSENGECAREATWELRHGCCDYSLLECDAHKAQLEGWIQDELAWLRCSTTGQDIKKILPRWRPL